MRTDVIVAMSGVDYFSVATCNIPESSLSVKGMCFDLGDHSDVFINVLTDCNCSAGMRVRAWKSGVHEPWGSVRNRTGRILHCLRDVHWLRRIVCVVLPHPNREEASRYAPARLPLHVF